MSLVRRNPKRDKSERALIDYLKDKGVVCYQISMGDFPDLICRIRNIWVPVEVKSKGGKLTLGQETFINGAKSVGAPAYVISNRKEADQMLKEINVKWNRSRLRLVQDCP